MKPTSVLEPLLVAAALAPLAASAPLPFSAAVVGNPGGAGESTLEMPPETKREENGGYSADDGAVPLLDMSVSRRAPDGDNEPWEPDPEIGTSKRDALPEDADIVPPGESPPTIGPPSLKPRAPSADGDNEPWEPDPEIGTSKRDALPDAMTLPTIGPPSLRRRAPSADGDKEPWEPAPIVGPSKRDARGDDHDDGRGETPLEIGRLRRREAVAPPPWEGPPIIGPPM